MKAMTYALVGCAVLLTLSGVVVLGAVRIDPSLLDQSRWKHGRDAKLPRGDVANAGFRIDVAPAAQHEALSDSFVANPPLITLDGRIHSRGFRHYRPREVAQPAAIASRPIVLTNDHED